MTQMKHFKAVTDINIFIHFSNQKKKKKNFF